MGLPRPGDDASMTYMMTRSGSGRINAARAALAVNRTTRADVQLIQSHGSYLCHTVMNPVSQNEPIDQQQPGASAPRNRAPSNEQAMEQVPEDLG